VVLVDGLHPDLDRRIEPILGRLCAALQRANAARSPRGRVLVAPGRHHRIAEDRPDIVIAAIRNVASG
jgi:hypothetical protein